MFQRIHTLPLTGAVSPLPLAVSIAPLPLEVAVARLLVPVIQDQSLLIAMGLKEMPLDSDTESELDDETVLHSSLIPAENLPTFDVLMTKLQCGNYNWLFLADFLQELDYEESQIEDHLNTFYDYVIETVDAEQKSLVTTSHAAFSASAPNGTEQGMATALTGDIVTDSESDDAEDYVTINSLASEHVKGI